MNIGQAIAAMTAEPRPRMRRASWENIAWVAFMPEVTIPAGVVNGRTRHLLPENADLNCQGYFVAYTARGEWQPGWAPSQSDLLADDWRVVRP